MISELRLKNFKCFHRARIHFRPLTVLAGLNGSGKSSAIQALLCMQLMLLEEREGRSKLDLRNMPIPIGGMKDIFYQFNSTDSDVCSIEATVAARGGSCDVAFRFAYLIEDRDLEVIAVDKVGGQALEVAKDAFRSLKVLSAVRIGPRATHEYREVNVRSGDIGADGRYAVAYLSEHGRDIVLAGMRRSSSAESLLEQVNLWLQVISPGASIVLSYNGGADTVDLGFQYGSNDARKKFKPTNVGVGLSVVLPILVLVLSAKAGDCLIIENPESDLHPKGQAELARLFAQAASVGVQVIIETHSDHIINGIRVAAKRNYIKAMDVNLVAFKHCCDAADETHAEEQYSVVSEASIDNRGMMSKELPDFLDEWGRLVDDLVDFTNGDDDDGSSDDAI